MITTCEQCNERVEVDKGRAIDGRRAYRCKNCRQVWTVGLQGRKPTYNKQRIGIQFADTGSLAYRGVSK